MEDVTLRLASPADRLAISILLDTAFEGQAETVLVEELRAQNAMALEMVAHHKDALVGYIAFSRLERPENWIALAPVAVRYDHREQGIGSRLVQEGLDLLRQQHVPAVVVLGDPDFYHRFGFSLDAAKALSSIYPSENFMLYPLAEGIAGSTHDVEYARPFRYV